MERRKIKRFRKELAFYCPEANLQVAVDEFMAVGETVFIPRARRWDRTFAPELLRMVEESFGVKVAEKDLELYCFLHECGHIRTSSKTAMSLESYILGIISANFSRNFRNYFFHPVEFYAHQWAARVYRNRFGK